VVYKSELELSKGIFEPLCGVRFAWQLLISCDKFAPADCPTWILGRNWGFLALQSPKTFEKKKRVTAS